MKYQNRVCIVVDGFSTGSHIAPLMRANGFSCIHVQSRANMDPMITATYIPHDYILNLIWQDEDTFLSQITEFQIKWIIPGAETGVLLADRMSHILKLDTANDFHLSEARRNKFKMIEAIKAAKLQSAEHIKVCSLEEAVMWIEKNQIDYPVVLKPLDAGGTDGVMICYDESMLAKAFERVIDKPNVMGYINKEVVIQTFLTGPEYAVNTVSYQGQHFVTEILHARKRIVHGFPIYDYSELVSLQDAPEQFTKLSEYAKQVLDALGIHFGAAHTEIIDVYQKGPTLVESGARINGGIDISAYTRALGYNQLSVLLDAYLNPQHFLEHTVSSRPLLRQHMRVVFLISDIAGDIVNPPNIVEIKALDSFHSIVIKDKGRLAKTEDFIHNSGYINLIADNKEALASDYQRIRAIEPELYRAMLKHNKAQ